MLMSTDVASLMLPVNRGIMDRERDIDTAAAAGAAAGPAAVRGMKRVDPEPDAQTAAALADLAGAECKRPRIDGTGSVVGEIGQVKSNQILHSHLIFFPISVLLWHHNILFSLSPYCKTFVPQHHQ